MKLGARLLKMIEYELCEINKNHFLKVLKCSSTSNKSEQMPIADKPKRTPVIVIIPGNPGVIEFYEEFAKDLNKLTGYDILGLSHTGHLYHDKLKYNWDPIDVFSQVNDKIKFIENYFMHTENDKANNGDPPEIYFIGHSFGCYVILEILALLNKDVKKCVKHAYLLFPMVERMLETPSGKQLHFITKYGLRLLYLIAYLITFLPKFIQKGVTDLVFTNRKPDLHDNIGEVVVNMCTSFPAIRSCFHLGRTELDNINVLNTNSIIQNYELLTFYYARKDGWAPQKFYYNMKHYIEDLHDKNGKKLKYERVIMDECHPPLEHAFVIFKQQSKKISELVYEWIQNSD